MSFRSLSACAAVALLAAALSGCGGAAKKTTADPGRDVLTAFLRAAAHGDTAKMRTLLSPQTSQRFPDRKLALLAGRLSPLVDSYRLVVSERLTDTFGVVGVVHQPDSYAAAVRKTGDRWGLELGGPVRIIPLGPDPGAREKRVRQIAASIENANGPGEALLYLDGLTLPEAKVYRLGSKLSIVVNLPIKVPAGSHSIVVFAGAGSNASARAWTFVVPK